MDYIVLQTVNQKYDETMETTLLRIKSASLLFENIIANFPPSWSFCSNYYKKLFFNPMGIEIDYKKSISLLWCMSKEDNLILLFLICSVRSNSSDGFVPIILALLDDILRDGEHDNTNSNAFDSMMNFQQYERIESGKSCVGPFRRTIFFKLLNTFHSPHFSIRCYLGTKKSIDCSSS